jgi:hypothetical protein
MKTELTAEGYHELRTKYIATMKDLMAVGFLVVLF